MQNKRLLSKNENPIGFIEPAKLHEKVNNFRKTNSIFSHNQTRTNINTDIRVLKVIKNEKKIQRIDPVYKLEWDSSRLKQRPNTKLEINTIKGSRNKRESMHDKQVEIGQSYNSSKAPTNDIANSINLDTLDSKYEDIGVCWGQVLTNQIANNLGNPSAPPNKELFITEYKNMQKERYKRIQPRKWEREILLKQGKIMF